MQSYTGCKAFGQKHPTLMTLDMNPKLLVTARALSLDPSFTARLAEQTWEAPSPTMQASLMSAPSTNGAPTAPTQDVPPPTYATNSVSGQ